MHNYIYLVDGGGLSGNWRGLCLSERGLKVLNAVPDILQGKEPLGKRLAVAIGKGSLDTLKQLIPILIDQGVKTLAEK